MPAAPAATHAPMARAMRAMCLNMPKSSCGERDCTTSAASAGADVACSFAMKFTPKKLKDQVVVITGASSGIGLATARMAARRGARVVMAARNEEDLKNAAEEVRVNGGRVLAVPTDVSDEAAVSRLGEAALLEFGTIDTWVNNAGLSIYGKLTEVPLADKRRLFDINFWGVVHGSRTAVRMMKHRGGVLINIGSEVSDVAIPLQGMYSASK